VLQIRLHVPQLLGVEPLRGRHHRAVHVDKDVAVEPVLTSVVLEAEDDLLRLPQSVGRDEHRATPLEHRVVYDLNHLLDGLGERLGLLVGQSGLHDQEVYVPHLRQPGRRDGEMILHADIAGVEYGGRTGPKQHTRRPKDMAALGERDLRAAHLERLAERDGNQPLLDLVDRRPTRNTPAHRCVVVERADDELG
jgi:hypothetical protein